MNDGLVHLVHGRPVALGEGASPPNYAILDEGRKARRLSDAARGAEDAAMADRGLDPRQIRGRRAETAAVAHIEGRGLRILARNVRLAGAEIDIVAEEGHTVVFVEVRSRSKPEFIHPLETVGPLKRDRIARAATAWLAGHRGPGRAARFDVVAVEWTKGRPICQWVRAAFDLAP